MKLELRGITKRFGALVANDHIDLTVEPGEIHCLLGENGAGKSTLMNVLYGLYQADEGEILLDDEVQHFAGPGDAMAAGIGMVHQHFMLIPVFTVAENVMLGHEADAVRRPPRPAAPRASGSARSPSGSASTSTPTPLIEDLPVGVQQRVEIIKALSRDAKVLVFDEPTAVLTPQETDELMAIMRQLKDAGHRHRLHHPQAARGARGRRPHHGHPARQGRRRGVARRRRNAELASLMVGRAVELTVAQGARRQPGERRAGRRRPLASSTRSASSSSTTSASSVTRGEILAVAGVQGNGQTELTEALLGPAAARHRATIRSTATSSPAAVVRKILDAGVGLRPGGPQRRRPGRRVHHRREPHARPLQRRAVRQGAATCSSATSTSSPRRRSRSSTSARRASTRRSARLSGGNQQKVVLARELSRDLRLFVAAQPTRGRRRRLDRVHPQAIVADPGRRSPGHRRLDRARRGRGAGRPDHGDVPRRDRRHRAGGHPP